MFSKACEYGIRAMIYTAQRSKEGRRVSIKEISRAIDSPEPFMAKILQDLVRKGVVDSIKGPNGGFFMGAKQEQTSLADIVTAIDGDELFIGCGLGLKKCNERNPCPVHFQFKKIRDDLQRMLGTTTLLDLASGLKDGVSVLKR